MKKCPYCSEQIQDSANKCRFCGERLETNTTKTSNKNDKSNDKETLTITSRQKRLLNFLIDMIFIIIIGCLLELMIAGIFSINLQSNDFNPTNALINIMGYIFIALYYIILESIGGKTIAKYITRTMVVNIKGDIPNFWNIVGRTLCRFIPFDQLSFFGKNPRGRHDSISKTYVIEEKKNRGEKKGLIAFLFMLGISTIVRISAFGLLSITNGIDEDIYDKQMKEYEEQKASNQQNKTTQIQNSYNDMTSSEFFAYYGISKEQLLDAQSFLSSIGKDPNQMNNDEFLASFDYRNGLDKDKIARSEAIIEKYNNLNKIK